LAVAATAIVAALLCAATLPLTSVANPSLGQLNSELGQVQARQSSLSASIASLAKLIGSLDNQIALVQSRENAVRAELDRDRVELAAAHAALVRERHLVALLKARLAHARFLLARQLVSSYENDPPDLITVVLNAHGFADLLEQFDFLRTAERQQQSTITITRTAKAQADAATVRLAKLEAADREITAATALRVRALAGMNALLRSREAALQTARAARQAALDASRARGAQLQAAISRVQAQQAAAEQAATSSSFGNSATSSGPALGSSAGWVIPYAIVLCESGGQNLPPNSAGASGYYQIIPSTWQEYGGTGPAAYLASKAEQDAVAARVWREVGPHAWDCAAIVGIH
jgi:septal ring factor EnvC (AmiA/AmiB activator)